MATVEIDIHAEAETLNKLSADVALQLRDVVKKTSAEEVIRAFTSSFDNPEIWAKFKDEITDMANTTRQIREKFQEVSDVLGEFDNHHYKKKDGSDIGALKPVWEGHHTVGSSLS